ncbi:MAG: hypothetical protein PHW74_14995, partial [Desulfobacca sp.]|nr:hypothetical protein [Desulfobacca sp.]
MTTEDRPRTDFEWIDHFVSLGATREFGKVFIAYLKDRQYPGLRSDFEWAEALQAAGATPEQTRAIIQVAY